MLWAYTGLILGFLLFPTLLLIPVSFGAAEHLQFPPRTLSVRWYAAYLHDPDWIRPTLFSVRVAALTAVSATLGGSMAALALVRGRLDRSGTLSSVFVLPLVFPGIVYAIAVLLLFAPLRLTGTLAGFVLAHTVLASPYVVLIVSAALTRSAPDLELAAMSLGASRLISIMRVTVPLIAPGILSGAVFAFHSSFDDATVSFFISGVTDKSLPRKMFENVEFSVSPVLAVVSTLFTVVTLIALALVSAWSARRPGRQVVPRDADAKTGGSLRDGLAAWKALGRPEMIPEGAEATPVERCASGW